ncbi:hypothetical protein [Phenylobacterium sp.]|jgi:hypothetical protein|uniref:hypothetical protein n=1 Tax=Phenylobacterium sp. TaxID=1871053 RepID=UPI002F952643
MSLHAALAALALLAAAAAPDAATMFQTLPDPGACARAQPAAAGQPLPLKGPLSETSAASLMAATFLALQDLSGSGALPAEAPAGGCPVARFAAEDRVWTIHAGGPAGARQLITTPERTDYFVVVSGPSLVDAAEWNRSRRGLPTVTRPPVYHLVGVDEDLHLLVRTYDGPPSAETVAQDLKDLLEARLEALATHQQAGGTVNLAVETLGGPQAMLFRPQDFKRGDTIAFYGPDGRFLRPGPGGGLVFRGSGYVCPTQYGDFGRSRVLLLDPSDESLDLACHLAGQESWLTVFVTRTPDTSDDRKVFEARIKAAEAESGVARRLSRPRRTAEVATRSWLDSDGRVQIMLVARFGEYVYEMHLTHTEAEQEAAGKAWLALMDQLENGAASPADQVEAWSAKR